MKFHEISKMRKCLTKFIRIFECGAVPEALFMVFQLDSKGVKVRRTLARSAFHSFLFSFFFSARRFGRAIPKRPSTVKCLAVKRTLLGTEMHSFSRKPYVHCRKRAVFRSRIHVLLQYFRVREVVFASFSFFLLFFGRRRLRCNQEK